MNKNNKQKKPKKFTDKEAEALRIGFALKERARLLLEVLIPLPCFEYAVATQSRQEFAAFECPSIDGEDPLCRTRRYLYEQLAFAMQINKYDSLHPEHNKLPQEVKDLIVKARQLKNEGFSPPPPHPRNERI